MSRRNRSLALSLAALALGMTMLAFASVPLYRLFCQATGFGGATRQVAAAPGAVPSARQMRVRFEANMDPRLEWDFYPGETEVTVPIGEQRLTYYVARNRTNKPLTGHATYNVVPEEAGGYFDKIQCFCFTDQTLAAGQEVRMPVSFFIDPAIEQNANLNGVRTITLSYTFFPAK